LLALGVALPVSNAAAAAGSITAPFRFYTVLDGITQSAVYDIEQDHAGYLWFTTARGLNRYDGKEFDSYTIADGLPNNSLTALHITETNSVWVGDVRGNITIIHGARVIHTIESSSEAITPILDIEDLGQRTFAVIEGLGVIEIVVENREFVTEPVGGESLGITGLVVDGSDMWAASSTGLYQLVLDSEPHFELRDASLRHIDIDSSGTLWAVDTGGTVGVWKDSAFDPAVQIDADKEIVSIVADRSGLIWSATEDQLFSFDSNAQSAESAAADISSYDGIDQVTSLYVDKENSLWLASGSRLIRFLGDRFRHYRLRTGLEPETVWSIGEDHHGRFWFGTQTKLLLREADESLLVVGEDRGVANGPVRDIVFAESGELWVGVREHGLFEVDVDTLRGKHIAASGDADILDIAVAPDGAVWYSTLESGVFRYTPWDQQHVRFQTPEGTSVYTIDTWEDGRVWYGADDVGIVQLIPNDDGGYDEQIIAGDVGLENRLFDHIRLIGPDSAWIATEEGGLYRYQDGVFRNFGSETPLADQTVYVVEAMQNGTLVVGGEQGLYQFEPGKPGIAHYNQQVGFIGLETNVHATFFDSAGQLWIGTVDGASRMDTSRPMPDSILPTPTIVRAETVLDRNQILDNKEIEPTQLGASVEYAAISLLNPREMEYSYKLVGVDNTWGPVTTNRSVSYPRIPPGDYEFMVRARNSGGEWSQESASHRFTVLPFFWQQPWFILGLILVVLFGFWAAMVYRTRHVEWTNNRLRAQVDERTASIEKARQNLEQSHEKLSREIEARAEIETRFRRAFENAPIGMGLIAKTGVLFDANPALKNMFWPAADTAPAVPFVDTINDNDRERFKTDYKKLTDGDSDSIDEKLVCVGADGEELQTIVNISAVRSESGAFLYSVLQIQDVTESLKLTDQLEYQASYDELTGLLNRRAFEAQLQRAWDMGKNVRTPSHLMFMDLDQFKVVNDTSGHSAGDQLLRAVSEILVDSVRTNDVVARLGGDEFGIILWDCPHDVARRIAESIRSALEVFRFHWDAEVYRIGVSIGGIPVDPALGDIGELQQLADAACYAAKEAGRNRVHMVAADKDSARAHRGQVRWVQRLREAMDNNRFAIYAQAIRPLSDDVVEPERLEVLLRLRDPDTRRIIPPGAFLPAAERYGLSVELDQWVVGSLLDTLFVHQSFHADQRNYWINLSGASIGDKRFAKFLMDAIERSPLPPGTINFEITETAVIRSVAEAGSLMMSLRDMGCKFALDDFGSGLSSFGYLKKLPVDYLKIDGMFIRDLLRDKTDRIFVKSIIDIAHTLNIKTVAEFIENDELLETVRELGADYAQGFAIGRPYVLAPKFPRAASSKSELADIQKIAG
jgi:diguanylate cyclase (GGDEF)-like protein/PAS domain S-box-containing protein